MSDDILERRERETERILALYEREAHKYDREMRVFEKLLFGITRRQFAANRIAHIWNLEDGCGGA